MLTVRRVRIQEIDSAGKEIGQPTFGVLANDAYEQQFTDIYESLEKLNEDARMQGSLLSLVGGFDGVDTSEVGYENFEGCVKLTGLSGT
jgi:hypothetical protein